MELFDEVAKHFGAEVTSEAKGWSHIHVRDGLVYMYADLRVSGAVERMWLSIYSSKGYCGGFDSYDEVWSLGKIITMYNAEVNSA